MKILLTLHYHPVELKNWGFVAPSTNFGGIGALTGIVTSIVNAAKISRSSAATRDSAKAAEEFAKFRLPS